MGRSYPAGRDDLPTIWARIWPARDDPLRKPSTSTAADDFLRRMLKNGSSRSKRAKLGFLADLKTALPVRQPQTAKLGNFFAQHFIVDAKKRAGRSLYLINFIIQRWDYYGQPTSCFFMAGLPPISAKMSQNGGSNPGSNPFFFA